jgi:hypothetical protein
MEDKLKCDSDYQWKFQAAISVSYKAHFVLWINA